MRSPELTIYEHMKTVFAQVDGATYTPIFGPYEPARIGELVSGKLQAGVPFIGCRVNGVTYPDDSTDGTLRWGTATIEVYYAENSLKTQEFPILVPDVLQRAYDVNAIIMTNTVDIDFFREFRLTSCRPIQNDSNGTVVLTSFEVAGIVLDYEDYESP